VASEEAEFAPTDAQIKDAQRMYAKRVQFVHDQIEQLFGQLKSKNPERSDADNREEALALVNRSENRQKRAVQKYGPDDIDEIALGIGLDDKRRLVKNQLDAMRVLIDQYLAELKQRPPREEGTGAFAMAALGGAIAGATAKFESRAQFYGRDQHGTIYNTVAPQIQKQAGASRYEWLRTTSKNPREKHLDRVGDIFPYDANIDHPGDLVNCKCGQRPIFD
jgi:hypothetical protein